MGYSEVHCQLCGVSFNISRVRSLEEPRTHAWSGSTKYRGLTFVSVNEASWHSRCLPSSGCSVVYREDARREIPRWAHGEVTSNEVEERNASLAQIDEDDSGDFMPLKDGDQAADAIGDDEYEFEEPPEECSDIDMEDFDDIDETASNHEYPRFIEGITKPQLIMHELSPKANSYCGSSSCSGLHTPARADDFFVQAESLCKQLKDEIKLPLFNNSAVEPANSSRLTGEERSNLDNNYSHLTHPKSIMSSVSETSQHYVDRLWEHIAGPRCVQAGAYTANSLSMVEMQGCTTAQALCLKSETEQVLQETDDEPWERDGKLFLSGIGDNMQSRDCGWLNVHPARRHRDEVHAEEYLWAFDPDAVNNYSMAFHPTCLEVYKRASILRTGSWDAAKLDAWWRDQDDRGHGHNIPRHQAIDRGNEQSWHHIHEDAWLAANPLFMPSLTDAVARASDSDLSHPIPRQMHAFGNLPTEIMREIFDYLEIAQVASTSVALPFLKPIAQPYLRARIMEDMPYLWESWCDVPYARWTGTTESELKAAQYAFDDNEKEIAFVLRVLKDEGAEEAYAACEDYWSSRKDQRFKKLRGAAWDVKDAVVLDLDKIDLALFLVELESMSKAGKLKGLQNRERIWKDCNYILDLIEQRKT